MDEDLAGGRFDGPGGTPPRNATVTTVAPTLTIHLLAYCSSGIEPMSTMLVLVRALAILDGVLFVVALWRFGRTRHVAN